MDTILPVEVRWYGNSLGFSIDPTSEHAISVALFNYGISAAAMIDVEIGDPYLQLIETDDGERMLAWFAQGATFPEGRQAQIADMYEARARLLFGT